MNIPCVCCSAIVSAMMTIAHGYGFTGKHFMVKETRLLFHFWGLENAAVIYLCNYPVAEMFVLLPSAKTKMYLRKFVTKIYLSVTRIL